MSFKELIINAGSSSLKYQVFDMPEAKVIAKGIFEQIGTDCTFTHKIDKDGKEVKDEKGDVIYETDDGKIAYDKKNGVRIPKYDENGYVLKREFTKGDDLLRNIN